MSSSSCCINQTHHHPHRDATNQRNFGLPANSIQSMSVDAVESSHEIEIFNKHCHEIHFQDGNNAPFPSSADGTRMFCARLNAPRTIQIISIVVYCAYYSCRAQNSIDNRLSNKEVCACVFRLRRLCSHFDSILFFGSLVL